MTQNLKILLASTIALIAIVLVTRWENQQFTKKITIHSSIKESKRILRTPPTFANKQLKVSNLAPKVKFKDSTPVPKQTEMINEDGSTRKSKFLSNGEIKKEIAKHFKLFKRCQANSLRNKTYEAGQMLVGFTILPKGVVDNVEVLSSTLKDSKLMNCILSVFLRSRFNSFEGQPLEISYPVLLE